MPEGNGISVDDDRKSELSDLVSQLGAGISEAHYRPAYEAAANVCSGIFSTIPVDLHDVTHEAIMAGYAAALRDLEKGNLDDQVRERADVIDG
ncbi:hypothetical protein [Streptomyces sp. NPDC005385]|uniref:hypothetical protein n=1 Tax=Streptomyces sp. NPDC005385 TaxID=3157039 RepID=UPI0033A2ACF9